MAESLRPLADPLAASLRLPPPAPPAVAAAAVAGLLAPPEAGSPAPPWLRVHQHRSFRRVVAALETHRGALLADPVGSGKTWIALAAAAAAGDGGPALAIVPATLLPQWRAAAARSGIPLVLSSHERASRGRIPEGDFRLVIVDESHRFRTPGTRRYAHLAPRLVGSRVLLVSATPLVNRAADLLHQLLLAVRDDALALHGVPSLTRLLERGAGHPALGELIVAHAGAPAAPPVIRCVAAATADEERAGARFVAALDRLRLSGSGGIAALVRSTLLRAAASSPAALAAVLGRYRRLLLQAQDARDAGRSPPRQALRELLGDGGDQLLMWALLPDGATGDELALDDLPRIAAVLEALDGADPKLARLAGLLGDGEPTLVFAELRATVHYLRRQLRPAPAWCTGRQAGIGPGRLPRGAVLDWFRPAADGRPRAAPAADAPAGPRVLVTTDVAAEGLDLQLASRVVHYDLPWTPSRLAQREGRAARMGSAHAAVSAWRLDPPRSLDRPLRRLAAIARKARLPSRLGLEHGWERSWTRWSELAERYGGTAQAGVAAVAAEHAGALVGVLLHDGRPRPPALVGCLDAAGRWSEEPERIARYLAQAAGAPAAAPPGDAEAAALLRAVAPAIRARLRAAYGDYGLSARPSPAARILLERLRLLARDAARRRDRAALGRLDRLMRLLGGGRTAGEERFLSGLIGQPDGRLLRELLRLPPPAPAPGALDVRLAGLVLFRSGGAPLRSAHAEALDDPVRPGRDPHRFDPPHSRQLPSHARQPRAAAGP